MFIPMSTGLVQYGGIKPYTTAVVSGKVSDKVVTFDITDPSNLSELDNVTDVNLGFGAYSLAVDDIRKVAFCRGFNKGYVSVDISNPASISILDSVGIVYQDIGQNAVYSPTQQQVYFGLPNSNNILSVDASNPSALVNEQNYSSAIYADNLYGVALDDTTNTLFGLSRDDSVLTSIDVSNPASLSGISTLGIGENGEGVEVDTARSILFCGGGSGFRTVDVSDTSAMTILDTDTTTSTSASHDISYDPINQIAVVGIESVGIYFYNVSNPSIISFIGSITAGVSGEFKSVQVDPIRMIAFSVERTQPYGILSAIDYSNPSSPVVLDTISSTNISEAYSVRLLT